MKNKIVASSPNRSLLFVIVGLTTWIFATYSAGQDVSGAGDTKSPVSTANPGIQQPSETGAATASPQSSSSSDLTDVPTNADSQGQRVFDALFMELDNMIPGDFEAGSPQKQAVENAVTAFQVQDLQRVSDIFKELSAKNKDYPPADLLLAALSYAVKDVDSGLILLERAAVEHPNYPGVYSAFARLALNQGRVSDALAQFEKCRRLIGGAGLEVKTSEYFEQQCLDGLIDCAMQQKRYDEARGFLEQLRETLPDNAKATLVSAELEFHQGDIDKSMEYLNSLKAKFPSSRVAESILASWFLQTGKPSDGEKWIRAAAEKYPDDPQVQLEFASWAINAEEFPTASSAIIKAEKGGSETLMSRNLKGKIAFCNRSYGVAEAHFKTISEQQPNNFDAINMYALSLIESDDPQKQKLARDIATRNFRALPDNLVAQAALGYIELKMGETEQARTILTRAARVSGTAPEIDFFLASLLQKSGENEQAKLVLEAALKHEGIFLYRSTAQQMLEQLKSSSDDLPTPKG